MNLDRAELAGTGAALAFHVALIAAMSMSLAHVASVPEPPSMEVEFVDEVGLTAAAPNQVAVPPPASAAPEIGEAEPIEPTPVPVIAPPAPRQVAIPAQRPPAKPTPAKPAPARPAPRVSRIGDDFLKGIADSPSASKAPTKPAAATYDARAKAQVGALILAQIKPCAERQRRIGNGAERMVVVLDLRLFISGRLKGAPHVSRIDGKDDDNERYAELATDQAIATYRECSPLRLPAELYATSEGGWGNIRLKYQVR